MSKSNILSIIGIAIIIIESLIDIFVCDISVGMTFVISAIALVFILLGLYYRKKEK